jgi:hypothetical protein
MVMGDISVTLNQKEAFAWPASSNRSKISRIEVAVFMRSRLFRRFKEVSGRARAREDLSL